MTSALARHLSGISLAVLLGATFSPAAWAMTVPIGPFTGDLSEVFTVDIDAPSMPLFGGFATATGSPSGFILTSGNWTFVSTQTPRSDPYFAGTASGIWDITFDSPIFQFGGYFSTHHGGTPDGLATFFDASDNVIDSELISFPNDAVWTWNGWQVTGGPGISRVTLASNAFDGAFVLLDDLEVSTSNPIPEPTTLLLLGSALAVLGLRRRRAA